jgi:ADP-ribosylglycohydrolase
VDQHRLLFGRGLGSDDTEHTVLVAQALTASAGEPEAFRRALARGLRRWFLLLPAGVGKATALACLRLLGGVSPERSGVFSAGNGPAMRAALLGVCHGDDLPHLRALVGVSTRVTHTDPQAEQGALAVALCAHRFARGQTDAADFVAALAGALEGEDATTLLAPVRRMAASIAAGEDTERFAETLGCGAGVSGYVLHTVPVALHAAFSHSDDFRAAVTTVIACGGDTDTTGAIVGGIVGTGVGAAGIPAEWVGGLAEWPCGVGFLTQTAERLAEVVASGRPRRPLSAPLPALFLRNVGFLAVVLYHGLRRLLPPYG